MPGHSFFENTACEYFPCHEVPEGTAFNCLFCFCPLYHLGAQCGGDFSYHGAIKDCSACTYPHDPAHYPAILARLQPKE